MPARTLPPSTASALPKLGAESVREEEDQTSFLLCRTAAEMSAEAGSSS